MSKRNNASEAKLTIKATNVINDKRSSAAAKSAATLTLAKQKAK